MMRTFVRMGEMDQTTPQCEVRYKQQEIVKLKAEVAELKAENERLKKDADPHGHCDDCGRPIWTGSWPKPSAEFQCGFCHVSETERAEVLALLEKIRPYVLGINDPDEFDDELAAMIERLKP